MVEGSQKTTTLSRRTEVWMPKVVDLIGRACVGLTYFLPGKKKKMAADVITTSRTRRSAASTPGEVRNLVPMMSTSRIASTARGPHWSLGVDRVLRTLLYCLLEGCVMRAFLWGGLLA